MAQTWPCWFWKLGQVSFLVVGYAIASSGDCALAQIAPDGTLPNNSIVTPQGNTSLISGGTQAGSNLFHSFEQFSVPTGGEASFNNALDIKNIISRVTGGSISNIDGLIRSLGTANVFLLNPNGINFGSNASLNIGGSFVGSTASSLNFADGTQFSATAPQATPLLTVSVPIGLQYGGTAGSIVNQSRAMNSSGQRVGLQVPSGKTLSLVGGDVRLDNGRLQAPGGRVELGGVAGAGTVGLDVDGNNLVLSFPDGMARADVSLTNRSRVNVAAGGSGSIAVNARNLDISGRSLLDAGISAGSRSVGSQAGDIEINATGAMTVERSDIFNTVESEAVGDGGNINVTAGSLSLTNGATLSTTTSGQGNAGSVTINARDTVAFDSVGSNNESSQAVSRVERTGSANSGDIKVTTGSLSLTNGAFLSATTAGRGNAGSVIINARDTVAFDGEVRNNISGAFSRVDDTAVGNGGDIKVTTGSLSVKNGARLNASTSGQGDAGSVTINARDTVAFDGVGSNSTISGAFSRVTSTGKGNAGNIEVVARSIRLDNQATLSSETGAGQGNISLRSQDLVLRGGSNITTNATGTAEGGNITIGTGVMAASEDSDISADAQNARGGRVIIDAQGIFGTEFREDNTPQSDITATSKLGPEFSGTVEINTPDVDPSSGLATLPAELVDVSGLIAQGCPGGGGSVGRGVSEFIIAGRSGLPPSPSEALRSDAVRVDLNRPIQGEENRSSAAPSTNSTRVSAPTQIVEATGWVINNKGEVFLTVTARTATLDIPWVPKSGCNAPEPKS